ncbi:MAG: hypothetical protein K2X38_16145 [Gemmataceae bacterium]|nr:hypothetical protein [Gemmataceae bacterium]
MSLKTVLTSLAMLVLVGSIAQADDLERIRNRDKLLFEKLQSDARSALDESGKLAARDPESARGLLQDTIARVRNSSAGTDEQRAEIVQRLQTRMRDINRSADVKRIADEEERRAIDDKNRRDPKRLPKAEGPSPGDIAASRIKGGHEQLAAADRLRAERALRQNDVFASIQQSATPIRGVVEYPKFWDRILARSKPNLSPKEVTLLKAMNSTLSVNFDREPLKNALNYLMEKTGQAIIVNEQSLKDANIEYDDPVTFKIEKITVRTILKKILADRGLTYVIQEGTIQVVTPERARAMMTVRTYPIGDLVNSQTAMQAQIMYGPFAAQFIRQQNAAGIISMLQNSVDPSMWNVNGGGGSMTYDDASQSIAVRASAELHYMLGNGMFGR